MDSKTIAPLDVFKHLKIGTGAAFLDVRSEGEFATGAFPHFFNSPILTDSERAQVGTTYKHNGQEAAMKLGHRLLEPDRERRIDIWRSHLSNAPVKIVTCWRGGLRSKLACEWLNEAQISTVRAEGGYKALRHLALEQFDNLPPLLILSGWTGSGKTRLITEKQMPAIDLEGLANHRGSAFGKAPGVAQPSQQNFENAVAVELYEQEQTVLIEDESASIGSVGVPKPLKIRMRESPVIFLDALMSDRERIVYDEYVRTPLETMDARELELNLTLSLTQLTRRLGGLRTSELQKMIQDAFLANARGPDPEAHYAWIRILLTEYYDKAYSHSFEKQNRKILFRGDIQACRDWIQNQQTRSTPFA